MHSPIHPTTQLDLYRGDAAARQRRAATHRFVHEQRPSRRRSRRSVALGGVAACLVLGIATGTATAAEDALPHGYEATHPDGWFDPQAPSGPVTTAAVSIDPAPGQLRQGYIQGRPDGWYDPARAGVVAAGTVAATTGGGGAVPANVR